MCQNKRYFIPCPWIVITWGKLAGKEKEQDDDEWMDKIKKEAWEEFLQEWTETQKNMESSLEIQQLDNEPVEYRG